MSKPDPENAGMHRITFELDGHMTALSLWHPCQPSIGDKIFLASSEWTVSAIQKEWVEHNDRAVMLTRYILADERPVTGIGVGSGPVIDTRRVVNDGDFAAEEG